VIKKLVARIIVTETKHLEKQKSLLQLQEALITVRLKRPERQEDRMKKPTIWLLSDGPAGARASGHF